MKSEERRVKNSIAKAVVRRYGAPAVPLKQASSKNGRTTQGSKKVMSGSLAWVGTARALYLLQTPILATKAV